jgi:hypothetical protein
VYDDLAARGLVRRVDTTVVWVFTTTTWRTTDPGLRRMLLGQMYAVLTGSAEPDATSYALISLLRAMRSLGPILVPGADRRTRKTLEATAEQLTRGAWAADAVRKAIDEAAAASTGAGSAAAGGATAASC